MTASCKKSSSQDDISATCQSVVFFILYHSPVG